MQKEAILSPPEIENLLGARKITSTSTKDFTEEGKLNENLFYPTYPMLKIPLSEMKIEENVEDTY